MDDDEGTRNYLIHPSGSHNLKDCQVFKGMSLEDKKKGINGNLICYISLGECKLSNCTMTSQKCQKCSSKHHYTLFHIYILKNLKPSQQTVLTSWKRRYLLLYAPQSVGISSMEEAVEKLFWLRHRYQAPWQGFGCLCYFG